MSYIRTSQSAPNGLTQTDSECNVTRQPFSAAPASKSLNDSKNVQLRQRPMDSPLRDTSHVVLKRSDLVSHQRPNGSQLERIPSDSRLSDSDGATSKHCDVALETGQPDELNEAGLAKVSDNYVQFYKTTPANTQGSLSTLQPTNVYQFMNDYEKVNVASAECLQGHTSGSRQRVVTAEAESSSGSAYEDISKPTVVHERWKGNSTDVDLRHELEKSQNEHKTLVYKLVEFVESNGHLQDQLQASQAETRTLKQQLESAEMDKLTLETKLTDSVRKNQRLTAELDRYHSELAKLIPREVYCASNQDSMFNFDETVQEVHRLLRQAVEMVLAQQKELETTHQVIQRQSAMIDELGKRYISQVRHQGYTEQRTITRPAISSTVSNSAPLMPAAEWKFPIADVIQLAHPSTVNDLTTSASVLSNATLHPERLNIAVRSEQHRKASSVSNDRDVNVDMTRPPSNNLAVASGGPSAENATREDRRTKAASGLLPTRDAGVQMKYPPINSCPICFLPIPVEASSPDAFSRHVDECLTRVTREVPTPLSAAHSATARPADDHEARACPMCDRRFPVDRYTAIEFEQHVNDHFIDPIVGEFEVLNRPR